MPDEHGDFLGLIRGCIRFEIESNSKHSTYIDISCAKMSCSTFQENCKSRINDI